MTIKTRSVALLGVALVAVAGFLAWRLSSPGRTSAQIDRPGTRSPVARPRSVVDAWRTSRSQSPGIVAGMVKDGDGRAVPGALVALVVAGAYEDLQDKTSLRPQGMVVADQNGAFRFANTPPGQYLLTATADGWLPAERTGVALLAGETIDDLELRLSRGGVRLRGRVFDAGGGQIAGASVRALALGAGGRPDGARTFVGVAGPDGEYRLVLGRARYRVVADADGYSPQDARISLDSDRTQDFRLVPGARITGRAIDPNGAEVAGATVRIESDAVILRPSRAVVSRTTRTDLGGRFAFTGVPGGSYRVSGSAAGLMGVARRKVIVSAGASVDVLLALAPGPIVTGRVLDGGGLAVAGARVRAGEVASAASTADGRYRLEGLVSGTHTLLADAPGLAATRRQVTLGVVDLAGVDLRLEREARVSGRVFGRDGRPAAGANVTALVATRDVLADQVTSTAVGRTDATGNFSLGGLGPGDLRMEAEHAEQGRGVAGPVPLAVGGAAELEIHIGRGGMVRGVVRWEDQGPAAGAVVSGSERRLPPISAVADEQGRYELGPFSAGEITVDARPETDALERGGSTTERRLQVTSGRDIDGVDFKLTRRDQEISGVVRDPDGKPVAGATVGIARPFRGVSYRPYNKYAGEADASDYSVLTDGQGSFTLRYLPKGVLDVWATHPEYVEGDSYGVAAGARGVVIQVGRGGSLAGRAVDRSGKPVPAYNVSALLSQTNDSSAQLRAAQGYVQAMASVHHPDGAFELGGLHAATYDVLLMTADGRGGRLRRIALGAAEARRDLVVTVGDTSTITGRVVDEATSAPIPGVTVVATLAMLVADVRTRTGPDGGFRLEGVVPGETILVTIRGDGRSHGIKRQPVPVPEGTKEADAGVIKLAAPKPPPTAAR